MILILLFSRFMRGHIAMTGHLNAIFVIKSFTEKSQCKSINGDNMG